MGTFGYTFKPESTEDTRSYRALFRAKHTPPGSFVANMTFRAKDSLVVRVLCWLIHDRSSLLTWVAVVGILQSCYVGKFSIPDAKMNLRVAEALNAINARLPITIGANFELDWSKKEVSLSYVARQRCCIVVLISLLLSVFVFDLCSSCSRC